MVVGNLAEIALDGFTESSRGEYGEACVPKLEFGCAMYLAVFPHVSVFTVASHFGAELGRGGPFSGSDSAYHIDLQMSNGSASTKAVCRK